MRKAIELAYERWQHTRYISLHRSRRHPLLAAGLLSAVLAATPTPGSTQECNAILAYVRDTTSVYSSSYKFSSFKRFFCDQQFSSYAQASDAAGQVGISLGFLGISLGGHNRSTDWTAYQRTVCESVENDSWESETLRFNVAVANANVVQAWLECLTAPGFHFYAEGNVDDPHLVALLAKYNSDGPPYTTMTRGAVAVRPAGSLDCSGDSIQTGTVLDSAPQVLNCQRLTDAPVTATLSTVNGAQVVQLPRIIQQAPAPVLPPFKTSMFTTTGAVAQHPHAEIALPLGHKLLSGGARVNYREPGNLLTASYPQTSGKWVADAKDHAVASPASITVFAVALNDPNDEWEVHIFTATSEPQQHPSAKVSIPNGYILTGCGAQVHWTGWGSLLTAAYPSTDHTCEASSKDHAVADVGTITAYAIGVRPKNGAKLPSVQIFANTGSVAAHPSAEVAVGQGFILVGGGARDNWSGYGNLLTANFPSSSSTWRGDGKDHMVSSPSSITVYAIGVRLPDGMTALQPRAQGNLR